MPKFLPYDTTQNLLIPINLSEQLVPGTFEYTLNYLVGHELDTSIFHDHYRNDDNGRPAYDPAMLLKVVLFAYSRGITSSRQIARACRENLVFMALSADSQPHFTTIADFISRMHQPVGLLFLQLMKDKIDSPEGRRIYSKRLGTAEPPFGHMQEMGLTRFSLRGGEKVNGQWRLMCSLHNLKKIHRYGGEKLNSRMAKAV
ncbi:transposase [Endozoicomonadaceae bacterium StTr2]